MSTDYYFNYTWQHQPKFFMTNGFRSTFIFSGCPIPLSCKNQDHRSSAETYNIKWTEQWSANDFKSVMNIVVQWHTPTKSSAMLPGLQSRNYDTTPSKVATEWTDAWQLPSVVNQASVRGPTILPSQLWSTLNRFSTWKLHVLLICTNGKLHQSLDSGSHATTVVLTMTFYN